MTQLQQYCNRKALANKAKETSIRYNRPHDGRKKAGEYGRPYDFMHGWRWVEYPSDGLRFKGKAHEIARQEDHPRMIEHTGWYVDSFQDSTCHGEVFQLPGRDGKAQYVPAVSDAFGNDGSLFDFSEVTDDLLECVRRADRMAELYAEDAREADAKDQAERRIEEINEEIAESRYRLLTLIKELRAGCNRLTGMTATRQAIRQHIRRVRAECERLASERTKIEREGLPIW